MLASPAPRIALPVLLAASLGFGAVACTKKAKPKPTDFVDRRAGVVFHVPKVGPLSAGLEEILKAVATGPLQQDIDGLRFAMTSSIGFDPFTQTGLKSAGLDPAGEMVMALDASGNRPYAVLPAGDPERLDLNLKRFFKDFQQADPAEKSAHKGTEIQAYTRTSGEQKLMVGAVARFDKYFLVALRGLDDSADAGPVETIRAALDRSQMTGDQKGTESLPANLRYKALADRMKGKAGQLATFYTDSRGPLTQNVEVLKSLMVGLKAGKAGLDLVGVGEGDPVQLQLAQPLLGVATAPPKFAKMRGGAPFLGLKVAVKPDAVFDFVKAASAESGQDVGAQIKAFDEGLGIDLRQELLPILSGNMFFVWALGDIRPLLTGQLASATSALSEGRLLKPGSIVQVTDEKKLQALLKKVEAAQLAKEVPLEQVQVAGKKAMRARPTVTGKEQQILWVVDGTTLMVAFDQEILEGMIKGPATPPAAEVDALLSKANWQVLHVDLPSLSAALASAVEGEAAAGMSALTLKLFLAKAETLLEKLGDVMVGIELKGAEVNAEASIKLR